jgi:hypothetical protein
MKASTAKTRGLAVLAQAGCDGNTKLLEQTINEGDLFSYIM